MRAIIKKQFGCIYGYKSVYVGYKFGKPSKLHLSEDVVY